MRFLRPDLAQWALVLPLLVAFWAVHQRIKVAFRRRTPIAPRFAGLSRRSTTGRDLAVMTAALAMAGALVFALVRPQLLLTRRTPEYERQDLVVMLDRSVSMQARDIRPSRFSRAIEELRNLVRQKPEGLGRIALVGFADTSVVLSYLTDDGDSLLFYLDWIEQDPTPMLGTNIGAALKSAYEVAGKDTRQTRKLFLILSDGEDYGTELQRAVDTARAQGYRVNCVGIGAAAPVRIPLRSPDGKETVLRDEAGQPVTTTFSETTLREIAASTGGRYVRSTSGADLQGALAAILAGERRIVGYRTTTEYRDLYPLALALAAAAGAGLWLLM